MPLCFIEGRLTAVPAYSVWTDHANFISLAYSGTGALKTDFTRTGKRTRKGLFEDGYNSVMRYLKNNFLDGARQVRTQFIRHVLAGSHPFVIGCV